MTKKGGRKTFEELSQKMQDFITVYAETGNKAEACRRAGCSKALGVQCLQRYSYLLEDIVQDKIAAAGLAGLHMLDKLIKETKNDMVKFNAVKYVMGLAGYTAVEKKEITVNSLSDEQVNKELERILGKEVGEADIIELKAVK